MGNANQSGVKFESLVEHYLEINGIYYFHHPKDLSFIGLDGEKTEPDFYLPDIDTGIYLECRRQDSEGSADKKTPHLAKNILEFYDKPTIVVVHGIKTKKIIRYLQEEQDGRQLKVMTFEQFTFYIDKISNGDHPKINITKMFDPSQKKLW